MDFINKINLNGTEYNISDGTLFPAFDSEIQYYENNIVTSPNDGKPYFFLKSHIGEWSDADVSELTSDRFSYINSFVVIDYDELSFDSIDYEKNTFVKNGDYLFQYAGYVKSDGMIVEYRFYNVTIINNVPTVMYINLTSDSKEINTVELALKDHTHTSFPLVYDSESKLLTIPSVTLVESD